MKKNNNRDLLQEYRNARKDFRNNSKQLPSSKQFKSLNNKQQLNALNELKAEKRKNKANNALNNEYKKLKKQFLENKRQANTQGIRLNSTFPSSKEFNTFKPNQKTSIVKNLRKQVKSTRSKSSKKLLDNLNKNGISYSINKKSKNKEVAKIVNRNNRAKQREKLEEQRAKQESRREDLINRQERKERIAREKERIKEERERNAKEQVKGYRIASRAISSPSNAFGLRNINRLNDRIRTFKRDALRYGIEINDLDFSEIGKALENNETKGKELKRLNTIISTQNITTRLTTKKALESKLKKLGLSYEDVAKNRTKPVTYEEVADFQKLRQQYNQKKNLFNEASNTKKIKEAISLDNYLKMDKAEREQELFKIQNVAKRYNSTILDTASKLDNTTKETNTSQELERLDQIENKKLSEEEVAKRPKLYKKLDNDFYYDIRQVAKDQSGLVDLRQFDSNQVNTVDYITSNIYDTIKNHLEDSGFDSIKHFENVQNNIKNIDLSDIPDTYLKSFSDSDEELYFDKSEPSEFKKYLSEQLKLNIERDNRKQELKQEPNQEPNQEPSEDNYNSNILGSLLELDDLIEDGEGERVDFDFTTLIRDESLRRHQEDKENFDFNKLTEEDIKYQKENIFFDKIKKQDNYDTFLNFLTANTSWNDTLIERLAEELNQFFNEENESGMSLLDFKKEFFDKLDLKDTLSYVYNLDFNDFDSNRAEEFSRVLVNQQAILIDYLREKMKQLKDEGEI